MTAEPGASDGRRAIRVLILEDRAIDAELMMLELRRGGFAPDWVRVETEEAYSRALSPDFDVILADYTLPQFTAPAALKILQDRGLDVPFLVVTGTVVEERVVECIRRGAFDYLLKDRLSRLGSAVERALTDRALRRREGRLAEERRQAVADLQATQEYLHRLVRASPAIVYSADVVPPYAVRFISDNVTAQFGYAPSEFLEHPEFWVDRVHPDDRARIEVALMARPQSGLRTLNYRFRHADGTYRWTREEARCVSGETGAADQLVGYWIDVTSEHRAREQQRESEDRYRALVEASPYAIVLFRANEILYANPTAVQMFGARDNAHLLAAPTMDLIHPEDRERIGAHIRRIAAGERTIPDDTRLVTLDGTVIEAEAIGSVCSYDGIPAVQVILRDVTARNTAIRERARVESELRRNREYLDRLVNASPVIIFSAQTTPPYATRYVSDNVRGVLGYSPEDFASDPAFWPSRIHPDDLAVEGERLAAAIARGDTIACEYRFRHADGNYRWMNSQARLVPAGDTTEMVGFWLDVTDRKRIEAERREFERRFGAIFDHAAIGIAQVDVDGHFVEVNESLCVLFGLSREELLDRGLRDLMPAATWPADAARIAEVASGARASDSFERRCIRDDGLPVSIRLTISFKQADAHTAAWGVALFDDVSARASAEEGQRREHTMRNAIEESVQTGVIAIDADGRITYVNRGFEQLTGWPRNELVGLMPPYPYWIDADVPARTALMERLRQGAQPPGTGIVGPIRKHDGGTMDAVIYVSPMRDPDGSVTGWVGSLHDLTKWNDLEEQLRQAQKMEAVGRLAGGVAHDFNNMLSAILGYCELLLEQVPPSHPLRSDIEEIRHAGESASSLTRQLLAFSRRQLLKPEVLDPNAVISALAKILQRTLGEDVHLKTVLGEAAGHVRADRGQLEQLLMNLSVNARDAMPKGGSIVIRTAAARVDAQLTRGRWTVPPGEYALVEVEDSGCGMTPDVLSHLFEPFYTTKPAGKGTGLGLPTVYGIVTQSGGHIAVESEVGRGTVVAVYLPRSAAPLADDAPPALEDASAPPTETVLVVDDNTAVRLLARQALAARGYRVMSAADAEEAERLADQQAGPLHLLVTDVVMPGRSGVELAARLKTPRPGLKVLFTSGYADESLLAHGLDTRAAFLQKPFTPSALVAAVRGVLKEPLPAGAPASRP